MVIFLAFSFGFIFLSFRIFLSAEMELRRMKGQEHFITRWLNAYTRSAAPGGEVRPYDEPLFD